MYNVIIVLKNINIRNKIVAFENKRLSDEVFILKSKTDEIKQQYQRITVDIIDITNFKAKIVIPLLKKLKKKLI